MADGVWLIRITAPMEVQVHGIHLRETIHAAIVKFSEVSKTQVRWHVRSVKNKAEVDVKIVSDSEIIPRALFEVISKALTKDFRQATVESPAHSTADRPNDFQEFVIYREDELSEMVWALQGAGREFRGAIEAVLARDKKKKDALLKAAMSELALNQQIIDENQRNGSEYALSTSVTLALLNNVEGFDDDDSEVLGELARMVALCHAYNSDLHQTNASNPNSDIAGYLKDLPTQIIELLSKLKPLTDTDTNNRG